MDDLKKYKLNDDLELAIEMTKNPNNARFNYMGSYSQIIGVTNENQKEINKIVDFQDKSVLLTGSSGEQYLSSVYYGSNKETIYDINPLAEYYIFLKLAAIRNLSFAQYIEFILPFINKKKYFNTKTLKHLLFSVDPYIKEFWTLFIEEVDMNKIYNLIVFIDNNLNSINNKLPYYSEDNYTYLQKILNKKENPKFIEMDAAYFEHSIKDKYDFISLSNIIECSQQPFDNIMETKLYTNEEWIDYLKNVVIRSLNDNGKILVIKTGDWYTSEFENAGFTKHLISSNNPEQKNSALILKR